MPLHESDRPEFLRVLDACAAMYRCELSSDVVELWWNVLADYDIVAVKAGLTKHVRNPDTGQFMPKPADVIKFLEGTTQDTALFAWATVYQKIKHEGAWSSPLFDDPLIHVVLRDMGGWTLLCELREADVPFRAKEFENRYRAYARRGEVPRDVPLLHGFLEIGNSANGYPSLPIEQCGIPLPSWLTAQLEQRKLAPPG